MTNNEINKKLKELANRTSVKILSDVLGISTATIYKHIEDASLSFYKTVRAQIEYVLEESNILNWPSMEKLRELMQDGEMLSLSALVNIKKKHPDKMEWLDPKRKQLHYMFRTGRTVMLQSEMYQNMVAVYFNIKGGNYETFVETVSKGTTEFKEDKSSGTDRDNPFVTPQQLVETLNAIKELRVEVNNISNTIDEIIESRKQSSQEVATTEAGNQAITKRIMVVAERGTDAKIKMAAYTLSKNVSKEQSIGELILDHPGIVERLLAVEVFEFEISI